MPSDSQKLRRQSRFVQCAGCGRQMRVAVERLLSQDRILCGWCEQDLLRAEQVRAEVTAFGGLAQGDRSRNG
jgi:hypothetical protein